MKAKLLALIPLFFSCVAFSQEINYQKTFQQALEKSKKEHKLVFAVITTPGFRGFAAVKSGLADPDVIAFYNKNFIPFTTNISDTATMSQFRKYQPGNFFPCYLFIDDSANLVYKFTGNVVQPSAYMAVANNAIEKYTSGKTVTTYEERYRSGKVDAAFLKGYIEMREDIGLYDNAALIDKYVDFLTIGNFNDYQTVLFVLKAGPIAFSKAYSLAFTNKKLTDSLYKTEPVQLRSAINSRIMANTRAKAIADKDVKLARSLANFTGNMKGKDYRRGNRDAQSEMLYYYRSVKDTASYYREAEFFYDDNYMHVSADSAKKLLDIQKQNMVKNGMLGINSLVKIDTTKGKVKLVSKEVGVSSEVDPVANTLNSAAWTFYLLGTKSNQHLLKALLWSRRSIEMSPDNYAFYDTYAHLLYRLDLRGDAEEAESKAISLAKEHNFNPVETDNLIAELKKMKEKKL